MELNLVDLRDLLDKIIIKNNNNMKLIKRVNEEFIKKNLALNTPTLLFEENIDIEELSINELICLTTAFYDYFKYDSLDVNKYFTGEQLLDYRVDVKDKQELGKVLKFEEVRKLDNKNYIWVGSAKEFSLLREYRKVAYFKKFQRASKIERLRDGTEVKKISINKESVNAMKNRFIDKSLFPTAISFTVLKLNGKTPNIKFEAEYKNTGTLYIEPNFDINDKQYAPFIVTDGMHRFTAKCNAQDETKKETGKDLDSDMPVIISIMTEDEASTYIEDVFKRNDTDIEWTRVIKPTDSNKFIDMLVEKSEFLNKNTIDTNAQLKKSSKLTSKAILQECMKYTNFQVSNEIFAEDEANLSATIIDNLIGYICKQYFENDIEQMKKTYLLSKSMFVGYIAIASKLINDNNYKSKLKLIGDKLYYNIDNDEIKSLNLNRVNTDFHEIYKYFDMIAEV